MNNVKVFRGKLRLLGQISRINLRQSLITLIGITIALSMISANLIYLESNKVDYYLDVLNDSNFEGPIIYSLFDDSNLNFSINNIHLIQNAINSNLETFHLNSTLKQQENPYTCKMTREVFFVNSSEDMTFYGLPFTEAFLKEGVKGSQIPAEQEDVWIFIPSSSNTTEIKLNETINLSISYRINDDKQFYNISLKVAGILNSTNLQSSFLADQISTSRVTFLMQANTYLELHNTLRTLSDESISNFIRFYYFFDFSHLDYHNVLQTVKDITAFGAWGGLEVQIDTQEEVSMYYLDKQIRFFSYRIETATYEFSTLGSMFIILTFPALIITFLLVNFSLGLINEGRRKFLSLYKMRGISKTFIFTAISLETLVLAILASIFGLLLSIPVFYLVSSTTGYMRFDFTKFPHSLIVSQSTIFSVLGIGLFLTFLLHFRTIIELANASIVHMEEQASKKKPRKRGRISQNFDIFLLSQGILGISLLVILMDLLSGSGGDDTVLIIFLPIIALLGIFSPFFLLIGFIFAYNRLTPVILHRLGRILWRKDRKILALATRNLNVSMKVTTRTTLLIALTISFLMILSSLPLSVSQHAINTTYYKAGSDLIIHTQDLPNNEAIENLSSELNSLPGLTSTQVKIVKIKTGDNLDIKMMGIETNFAEVAFWKGNYATKSLSTLVTALYSSQTQYPVIMDSSSASIEKLARNDNYLLDLNQKINTTIIDKTDFWPRLIERHDVDQRFFITKLSTLVEMVNGSGNYYIFCKIASNINQDGIITEAKIILEEFGVSLNSFDLTSEDLEVDPDTFNANFLWIIINFDFLVSLLVLLLLLFLFNLSRLINQAKEIGLSRSLGMKFRQVFLLMFTEPFLLVFISGLPGALIGLGLLMTFLSFAQGPPLSYDPPMILMIDIPSITIILGSILLVTVLSSFIASYRATRANISKILKVE